MSYKRTFLISDLENDVWIISRARGLRLPRYVDGFRNPVWAMSAAIRNAYGPLFEKCAIYPEDYLGMIELVISRAPFKQYSRAEERNALINP